MRYNSPLPAGALTLGVCLAGALSTQARVRFEPANVYLKVEMIADQLDQPAGIVVSADNQTVYVAESGAHRVVQIRDKQVRVLAHRGLKLEPPTVAYTRDPQWPTRPEDGFYLPHAIGLRTGGTLLVGERGQGGRLFEIDPKTIPLAVQELNTPWSGAPQGFTSLFVGPDEMCHATMKRAAESLEALPFGNTLLRDPEGHWSMIDYGPFADFSAITCDDSGRYMVVSEKRYADVAWYDMQRKVMIGELKKVDGVRHLALLKDGTTLASIEREDHTWSLVALDPLQREHAEWLGGLEAIGGMALHRETGHIYLTLAEAGKVLRISPLEAPPQKENQLELIRKEWEKDKLYPPAEWPEFFKTFVKELDVIEPINSRAAPNQGQRHLGRVTLAQFAESLPVVTAKLKARPDPKNTVVEKDPIAEIGFVIFSPDQSVVTSQAILPNLSLFYAKRASGRHVQTRFMHDLIKDSIHEATTWENMPEIMMTFPKATLVSPDDKNTKNRIKINFFGMGLGPDYHIDLYRNGSGVSRLRMEDGDHHVRYILEPYPEAPAAGGESILIANIAPHDRGWHKIGTNPVSFRLILDEAPLRQFHHGVDLTQANQPATPLEETVAKPFRGTWSRNDLAWPQKLVQRATLRWDVFKK